MLDFVLVQTFKMPNTLTAQTRKKPKVVCLSSLFMTDRILLHGDFLDHLESHAETVVLSRAVKEDSFPREHPRSRFFKYHDLEVDFPYSLTLLRHFENHLWDHTGQSFSRESMWRLRRGPNAQRREHLIRAAAKAFSPFGLEPWVSRRVESALVSSGAPAAAIAWLERERPSLLMAMYPFIEGQMAVVAAAKRLRIPVLAFITSWDNLSTKNRLTFDYDGYMVWSEHMKNELLEFHPPSRKYPIAVVGAPQYDVFRQQKFHEPREAFLKRYDLDPARPVILYCLGSPNLFREDYSAVQFFDRMNEREELRNAQVILRAHPGHLEKGLTELEKIRERHPQVIIQGPHRFWQKMPFQGEASIAEWVNTVRHADVVINLASTMSVDGSIFDKPIVNANFDSEPGKPNQQMIDDLNHRWNHFRPVTESGGLWEVNNIDEMLTATSVYLKTPELHREGRRRIVEHVCGQVDGQCGKRMANAVIGHLAGLSTAQAFDAVSTRDAKLQPVA